MNPERGNSSIWPVALMTLIATVLLGLSAEALAAPAIIGSLIILHLLTGRPRMPQPRPLLTLLLVIPFIFWWKYGMESLTHNYMPIALLNVMAFYVLALAAHHILAHDNGGSTDHALGCAVLAIGVAGAGPGQGQRHDLLWIYGLGLTIFAALMLIHLRRQLIARHAARSAGRKPRFRYAAAIIALLAIAAATELFAVPQVPQASEWLLGKLIPKRGHGNDAGFSRGTAKLGSIPELWGDPRHREQVMVRAVAERIDPYLRGAVYSLYAGDGFGAWSNSPAPSPRELGPEPQVAFLGRYIFNTQARSTGQWTATIYPATEICDTFFLPLGVHEIASFADKVFDEQGQVLRPEGYGAAGGYTIAIPAVENLGRPMVEDTYIPSHLDDQIADLAAEVLPDEMPAPAKVRRLEAWFHENFRYKIGIDLDHDRIGAAADPVVQFVNEIRAGHCEYFASAAVLMLRSVGVPARYVTGFVVEEPGMGGGWWIARRKHAHAWAEAYIEGQGWVRVEPTPPDGQPIAAAAAGAQRWTDWLAAQWERLVQLTLYGGITGLLGAAWDALIGLPQRLPIWGWLILIAAGLGWMFRRHIRTALRPRRDEPVTDRVRTLRQKLDQAERMLRRHGLSRAPGRTVSAYLRTVRSAPHLPPHIRALALPLLDEYARERFRRE